MKNKKIDEAEGKIIGFRVPLHFAKGIEEQAKKIGVNVSEYIAFCLIQDYRNNYVEKEIAEAVKKGSIYYAVYPTSEIAKKTLSEQAEEVTKEVRKHIDRKTKQGIN